MPSDSNSLDGLIRRARLREPDALTELVDRFGRRVYGLMVRLTGSRDVAEDLTQETFLRVVRTIEQYQHQDRFESWLFRIAGNLARDHSRRRRRRGLPASLDVADDGAVGEERVGRGVSSSPDEDLAQREVLDEVQACLAQLPELDREILMLRHFAAMSFREIAELLEVPLGTALARAHRALEKLRQMMGAGRSVVRKEAES